MKTLNEVEMELRRLGFRNRFWAKPEIRELKNILGDDEVMTNVVTGRHEGGSAMLLTTDRRLLMVDKKIFFLRLEDIRFDMVSEVDFHAHLFDSTVYVRTINKVLRFTSMHQKNLRELVHFLQERVMELRQQPYARDQQLLQQFSDIMNQSQSAQPISQVVPAAPVASSSTPRAFRQLGAYPTASFTTQQRNLNTPIYHRL